MCATLTVPQLRFLTAVSPHGLLCKQMHAQLKRLHEMEPTNIIKMVTLASEKILFRPIFHEDSKSPAVTGNFCISHSEAVGRSHKVKYYHVKQ